LKVNSVDAKQGITKNDVKSQTDSRTVKQKIN